MNINNINPHKNPISQLFDPASKVIYEIPKYQREYIWNVKHWDALFDDIMENDAGYFLGSIICINSSEDSINSPKFEVVDGQQRLITLSLLIAALYTKLHENYDKLNEDQKSDVIQIKRKLALKSKNSSMRVIPQIQNHNHDDYRGLLSDKHIIDDAYKLPKFAGNRRIVKAYHHFIECIETATNKAEEPIGELFKILDKINSAIVVIIEVSNHADAYMLFESLNNRGTPLTAVDLIKNLLLARLDIGEQADEQSDLNYYFTRWTEILDNLSDDYSVQERFFRQNYNAFRRELNIPFIKDDHPYPLGILATRSTLLGIYEKIVSRDPKGFLDDISKKSEIYAELILNRTDELSPQLKDSYLNLQRVQGAPAYLLLLYLVKNAIKLQVTEADIVKINKLLINFFVRRNLTDMPPTRDLNRIFMALVEHLEGKEITGDDVFMCVRDALIRCSSSDELFEEKLRGPVYDENSGATRFILCMIAQQGMTLENEKDLWRTTDSNQFVWTIEHIFPQGSNIPYSWVKMIAGGDSEKAKDYQSMYVHTFGNLTITGYNSTLSNKSFKEKKERKDNNGNYIGYLNGLNLNDDVCDKDEWTVDIIKERTDRMVKRILDMFKLYDGTNPVTKIKSSDASQSAVYEGERFFINVGKVKAAGYAVKEGFVVLAGSSVNKATGVTSLSESIINLREQYFDDGKVSKELKTTEDLFFTSSSAAADFLLGYSVSGPEYWKNGEGIELKRIVNK